MTAEAEALTKKMADSKQPGTEPKQEGEQIEPEPEPFQSEKFHQRRVRVLQVCQLVPGKWIRSPVGEEGCWLQHLSLISNVVSTVFLEHDEGDTLPYKLVERGVEGFDGGKLGIDKEHWLDIHEGWGGAENKNIIMDFETTGPHKLHWRYTHFLKGMVDSHYNDEHVRLTTFNASRINYMTLDGEIYLAVKSEKPPTKPMRLLVTTLNIYGKYEGGAEGLMFGDTNLAGEGGRMFGCSDCNYRSVHMANARVPLQYYVDDSSPAPSPPPPASEETHKAD